MPYRDPVFVCYSQNPIEAHGVPGVTCDLTPLTRQLSDGLPHKHARRTGGNPVRPLGKMRVFRPLRLALPNAVPERITLTNHLHFPHSTWNWRHLLKVMKTVS